MRRFITALIVVVFAAAFGLGSAWFALKAQDRWATIANGPWHADLAAGSSDAGLYTRANIAIGALLALNKSETIYYIAEEDEQGQGLRSTCDYRIEGRDLDTRWWSITLYGADRFLIKNERARFSYGATTVARDGDRSYVIRISTMPKPGNWLPSGDNAQLFLLLRLYNPAPTIYNDPAGITLPRIVRERCS